MGTPPAEEILKKIQQLEAGHAHLKQEMSKLKLSGERGHRQRSHSVSPQRSRLGAPRRRTRGGALEGAGAWMEKGSSSFKHASPLQRESRSYARSQNDGEGGGGPSAVNFTDRQYLNILQSVGQSVHILDLNGRIIYWNRSAENLYGYAAEEVLGHDGIELLIDPRDVASANDIISHVTVGKSWTGQFPVKNKMGEKFLAVATNTPFYDDDGSLVGIICVSSDSRPFLEMGVPFSGVENSEPDSGSTRPRSSITNKPGLDSQQPLQVALASKITNLASKVSNKVKSRIWAGENNVDGEGGSGESHNSEHNFSDCVLSDQREDANSSGASTPRGDVSPSPFRVFSNVEEKSRAKTLGDSGDESEGKPIHKIITSSAEAWIQKKTLSWPWRANDRGGLEARNSRVAWPWLQNYQENEPVNEKILSSGLKIESQSGESNRPLNHEASGSWSSSFNVNSTSSGSSCGSASSCPANNKVDVDSDCLDCEILWEDLTVGEQIGQGSCGTVYHALWMLPSRYFRSKNTQMM